MTPLRLFFILIFITLVTLAGMYKYVQDVTRESLPTLEQLENPRQELATSIVSSDGELLDHFYIKRRTYISYDSIPKDFVNALIATEDRKFFNHWGVHLMRIVKAFVKNAISLRVKEGASTVTQQLARNLYFNREVSLGRKIKEAITAVLIEQTYTKEEIIEMYANTVYFGRGAYGIQIAAQIYFNKSAMDLRTSECAYLVGLLKGPEVYNAINHYEAAIERRNIVLSLMLENDIISASEYEIASEEPIVLGSSKSLKIKRFDQAPHFVEMIRLALSKDDRLGEYDLYRDGLTITSTLNSIVQTHAQSAVREHLEIFQRQFDATWSWSRNKKLLGILVDKAIKGREEYIVAPKDNKDKVYRFFQTHEPFIDSVKRAATTVQVGFVALDAKTGGIIAMVGASPQTKVYGTDIRYSLNHVTQIQRQPGSSFKPFVYASALEQGMSPSSPIGVGPYSWTSPSGVTWSPKGTLGDGGSVPLSVALKYSVNTAAARLITEKTTPSQVIALVKKMGISTKLDNYPPIALGSEEVIPLEMAGAYSTFLNNGYYFKPEYIERIDDRFGKSIVSNKLPVSVKEVTNKRVAQDMTIMMTGVVNSGTATSIRNWYKFDAAGKTGTTNSYTDAWFAGYTPQIVAVVWVGFDDPRVKFTGWYAQGGKAAAPIWGRFMGKVYSDPRLPYKQTKFTVDRSKIDTTKATKEINENEDNPLDANSINANSNNLNEEVNLPQEAPKEPVTPKEPSDKKSTDAKPSPATLPPKRKFPSLNN